MRSHAARFWTPAKSASAREELFDVGRDATAIERLADDFLRRALGVSVSREGLAAAAVADLDRASQR
jgi:hypothetical protein